MKSAGWVGLLVGLSIVITPMVGTAHETKEVAGLQVVFGAEPEPALTGQPHYLRWRFRVKETKQPFAELEDLRAVVKRDGKDYGPFEGRLVARDPGLVQTLHIFTKPGEYETTLTFKKKGEAVTHSVAFTFRIRNRKELEIP